MSVFLKRWEELKANFEKTANQKRPQETTKKILLGTVQKSSGLTPVLKEVDAALDKKQRLPLEQALNKLFGVRGTYAMFLTNEQKKFLNDPNDPDLVIWQAYHALIFGIQKIEEDASKAAKALQEAKSPGKTAIQWFSLEGDVKGTVLAAKKGFTPYAALEKKYNTLAKANGALMAAEAYTKAAARTQFKDAKNALELFKKEAKLCADYSDRVLVGDIDAGYKKALKSFHDATKALSTLARNDEQIRRIEAAEKAG